MNLVVEMGRLTRDPEVRYTNGDAPMCIARYTIAVDRPQKSGNGEKAADFIPCVAFGRAGEFAEKYFQKGLKVAITGHLQSGSYKNRDGNTVYTLDVIIDKQEFAESKSASKREETPKTEGPVDSEGFMHVPDDIEDEGLPFN